MSLLIFIVTGFALFFLFRMLFRVSKALLRKAAFRKLGITLLPLLELVLWVAYAFWGAHIFFGAHLYYDLVVGAMVILLLVAVSWYVFRDFLAGVLLKAEKSLEPGQMIRTPSAGGKIKSLGSRYLELVNEEGEEVRIPYAKLSNEVFILPPENEDNWPHHVEVPLLAGQSPDAMQKRVLKLLHAMPWITPPAPEVKIKKTGDGSLLLHTTFYTHIRSQAVIVEERIREALTGPGPQ